MAICHPTADFEFQRWPPPTAKDFEIKGFLKQKDQNNWSGQLKWYLTTMPRVTRKQKDSGNAKPRAKSAPNASAKQGFKTAPSRAPKDAYLGKGMYSIFTRLGTVYLRCSIFC